MLSTNSKSDTASGVARISKLGGTPVTWPEGPMRGWGFGGGTAQRHRPPPRQLGGMGESCHYPHPPPPKKFRICTNPVAKPVDGRGGACPPLPSPVATLLDTGFRLIPKSVTLNGERQILRIGTVRMKVCDACADMGQLYIAHYRFGRLCRRNLRQRAPSLR